MQIVSPLKQLIGAQRLQDLQSVSFESFDLDLQSSLRGKHLLLLIPGTFCG